jgi:hypothetical protein
MKCEVAAIMRHAYGRRVESTSGSAFGEYRVVDYAQALFMFEDSEWLVPAATMAFFSPQHGEFLKGLLTFKFVTSL